MNWFGKKKDATKQPSAVSSTSSSSGGGTASRAKTANTVVSLRENIATQEKREEHLEKKIELCVKEAKEKMAKKDKKGEDKHLFISLGGACVVEMYDSLL
jgi:hypothetical protein